MARLWFYLDCDDKDADKMESIVQDMANSKDVELEWSETVLEDPEEEE